MFQVKYHIQARLAQSVEHETLNLRVVGSSPTLGELFFPATKFLLMYGLSVLEKNSNNCL